LFRIGRSLGGFLLSDALPAEAGTTNLKKTKNPRLTRNRGLQNCYLVSYKFSATVRVDDQCQDGEIMRE
jgi:hypothetical protein